MSSTKLIFANNTLRTLKSNVLLLVRTECLALSTIYRQYHAAAYNQKLWAVAYIINGGCSENGFHCSRDWLLSKGRQFYEKALQNLGLAADGIAPESEEGAEFEEEASAVGQAYMKLIGQGFHWPESPHTDFDSSQDVKRTEDDLPTLYPELCKKVDF